MTRIEQRLRDRIGLDANSIGSSVIQRAVRLRMKLLSLEKPEQYAALIDRSSKEWDQLVEAVVVTETWFFREPEAFSAVQRFIREEWLPNNPQGVLRILSVPCSSGEEPYSVVMALLQLGIRPERFLVEASDLSEAALGRAREGVYTRNSFRGTDLAFRDRHFSAAKKSFILDPKIRGYVSFFPGNLVGGDFPTRTVYDVIFCRNLLIYFDRATQKKALNQIARLLVPGGLLFVGPAEQPLIADHGFTPLGISMAFASRKTGRATTGLERIASVATKSPFASARANTTSSLPIPCGAKEPAEPTPAGTPDKDLETVRLFADAGNLREAASLCEAYLRNNTASAEGWYLLGLLREATQDSGAVECYRKALYLDPNHYETLLQMSLLAEKDGNETVARMFRGRANRSKIRASGRR